MEIPPRRFLLHNGFGNMLFTLIEHAVGGGELYAPDDSKEYIDEFFTNLNCTFINRDTVPSLHPQKDFFISLETAEQLPKDKILSFLKKPNEVPSFKHVCHLRFGDFMLKWPYCEIKPTRLYIEDAARELGITLEDITFVTDTPGFAKLILGQNIHIYDSGSQLGDFWALVNATESLIMSPSTFSFWGAYLGNAKRVIFPKNWAEDIILQGKRNYPHTFAAGTELVPNEERFTVIDNTRPLKVAIVSINLGVYSIFWDDFYKSAKRNLALDCERRFIVVSDDQTLSVDPGDRKVYHKTDKGYPKIMMEKEVVLYRLYELYKDCDYVVYFNSNCIFAKPVYGRDLGFDTGKPLVCAKHPGIVNPEGIAASVETDTRSVACFKKIPPMYFMGGFMAGRPQPFAAAMKEILDMEAADAASGFGLPKWHDESYWNRLVWNHQTLFKVLPETLTSYYPSTKSSEFSEREERIILRRKEDYLGENFREKLK